MKIRHFIPSAIISASSILVACGSKTPAKQLSQLADDPKLQTILVDTFSRKLPDKEKIIEFNKLLTKYNQNCDNYIIIDKKACSASVYSPDGKELMSAEVALGRNIGDKRGGGYYPRAAKIDAYTTPGEFFVSSEGTRKGSKDYNLYGERCLSLYGDHTQEAYKKTQVLALHRVPATPMGKLREKVLQNKTLKDNRVSFGCVNFLVETYDKMRKFIKGTGTKVYILPEEKGNSLHLEKQKDGSFKFFQTKYRYESQEPKLAVEKQDIPKIIEKNRIDMSKSSKKIIKEDSIVPNPDTIKSERIIKELDIKPPLLDKIDLDFDKDTISLIPS